jgi:hypothetical protein
MWRRTISAGRDDLCQEMILEAASFFGVFKTGLIWGGLIASEDRRAWTCTKPMSSGKVTVPGSAP